MIAKKRLNLVILEDRVGISAGYKGIFTRLCEENGLREENVKIATRSAYLSFSASSILEWRRPRKQPGFSSNPNTQETLTAWVQRVILKHEADAIICMDPSLLFLCNPDWSQATIDTLRGGVYIVFGIPWVISYPITAFHSKAKPKDLAKLNDGFIEKGDFDEYQSSLLEDDEESDGEDDEESTSADPIATFAKDSDDDKHVSRLMTQWHEPIIVPYGRIVLEFDFAKMGRLLQRMSNHARES